MSEEEESPASRLPDSAGVLSEDGFVSLIFSLQLLLAAALERRPA